MSDFANSVPRKEKVAKIDAEGSVRLVAPTRRTCTCVSVRGENAASKGKEENRPESPEQYWCAISLNRFELSGGRTLYSAHCCLRRCTPPEGSGWHCSCLALRRSRNRARGRSKTGGAPSRVSGLPMVEPAARQSKSDRNRQMIRIVPG